MSPGTLDQDLRTAAALYGGRTAVVAGANRVSFAELDERVSAFAAGLQSLGVRRGDRVAVVLRNSVQSAIAVYGILRAGAAFVVLNPTTKQQKLAHLLAHCGAVVAICDANTVARMRAVRPGLPDLRHIVVTGAEPLQDVAFDAVGGTEPAGLAAVDPDDLAAIIYTSGSTGMPKGATFRHRTMHFVTGSIADYLGLASEDRILSVLPLAHTYGLYQLVLAVRRGATLVLEQGIAFPGRVLQVLEAEQVTVLPGLPTIWQLLLGSGSGAPRRLPRLRLLTNAGAALSVTRLAEVRATFPNARLFSMYGQTECARVCYLPPEELDARPDSVGVPIPGTEAWVQDSHGHPAAPGEIGELMVRGEHVMEGYWADPDGSARKIACVAGAATRVLRTGDLFRTDDAGYLYFVARQDDIIKSGGEKIAPKEVEEVLYAAPGVREVAVVGAPDELLGEAVVAHVSAQPGRELDERALRRHCAALLEDFMVPRRVVLHEELPKTENGKLDRLALSARH